MCRALITLNIFLFSSLQLVVVSISTFPLLLGVPAGITSSALRLKICTITAGIKKYESIMKKKRKKHGHIVLLAKTKLNSIEVLISKALIDLYINHDKFVLVDV